MKITATTELPAILWSKARNPSPDSDLLERPASRKLPRRKTRNPSLSSSGVRLKRDVGAPAGKRSRPETPLLPWKFNDGRNNASARDDKLPAEHARKSNRKARTTVSARKLAAGFWRLQLPEVPINGVVPSRFEPGVGHANVPACKSHGSEAKELIQTSHSVGGPRNGFLCKFQPSFKFSNYAMEGVTKWNPGCQRISDEVKQLYANSKLVERQAGTASVISALEAELEQARGHIRELETERRSSKKKLEHFLRKLSEERAMWRSREHEKVRAIIDDIKADLTRERKNCQRMDIINSKLVNELAEAKLSVKRYMQEYEKERKARKLIEEVCDELAKEIGEDKAEVEALKRESMNIWEEVDEERRMLQMAEVWREERVQMKLIDAKVTLEEKYSQMSKLVSELEDFLRSRSGTTPKVEEIRQAELLYQAVASVNIQDTKEFAYEPPNPDDIFSVLEEVNFGELNEREIEPCTAYSPASHTSKIHTVSPEVNMLKKDMIKRQTDVYVDQNGDIEEDRSEWETVSHLEDQGSSYSPDGSVPSVNKIRRDSNVSDSGTEWEENIGEETPITEISEVFSVPSKQLKKVSSISRLWRSFSNNGENLKILTVEGMNGRLSTGGLSNGTFISLDQSSGKDGLCPSDLAAHWSSSESGNPHITRRMKGCIEWPRGAQKNSLKAKLLEARMESQKIQLRHVLKEKI